MKVPISISELSINGILAKAIAIKFPESTAIQTYSPCGVLLKAGNETIALAWEDDLCFNLAELFTLGYEIGDGTDLWHALQ